VDLPVVLPVTIAAGYSLSDSRPAYRADWLKARAILRQTTLDLIAWQAVPDVYVCGDDPLLREVPEDVRDDSDQSPDLGVLHLIVRQAGLVTGALCLYNVRVLSRGPEGLAIEAMPVPGFPGGWEAWGTVLGGVLSARLPAADGSAITVAALTFPSRPGHTWVSDPCLKMIRKLKRDGFRVEHHEDGSPARVAR